MNVPEILFRYITGLKTLDVSKIAGAVADDLSVITATATVNKEGFLAFLRALYAAFPDWHYDHDEPEIRAQEIVVKWRQGGTHTGTLALPGIAPVVATGKKVRIPEQFFYYRVRDNRIVEIRPEPIDGGVPHGILEQIGVEWPPLSKPHK
jgi:predicted ester cyclase